MLRPLLRRSARLRFALALAASCASALRAAPERPDEPEGPIDPTDTPPYDVIADTAPESDAAVTKTGGDWVVAPIPGYNPSQGANLKIAAQYILPASADAPPDAPRSVIGFGGFYNQEESRGVGLAYSGSLAADDWRVLAFAGLIHLNYDFYGIGTEAGDLGYSVPVSQDMHLGLLQVLRRFGPVHAGLRAQWQSIDASADLSSIPGYPALSQAEMKLDNAALGPALLWDTRDNQFFPTRGQLLQLQAQYFDAAFGSDSDYQVYQFTYNRYLPLAADEEVLAVRFHLRDAIGDEVPFFGLSQLGQGADIRGYIDGQYRDHLLLATQAEYRRFFTKRWGAAVFGGVGTVEPGFEDLGADDLLWAFGGGPRYRLSRKNPVSLRLDFAYGKDGPAWYFTIGEAF